MTTERRYGEDSPFGRWLRAQRDLDSRQFFFTANDADWIFHKYKADVGDRVGTRDVQLIMMVEVKTNGAMPNDSQAETLFFQHQLQNHKSMLKRCGGSSVGVWSFGVFVFCMAGTYPVDGSDMYWERSIWMATSDGPS